MSTYLMRGLLAALLASRVTAQGCDSLRVRVYWNNGGHFCSVDVSSFLISPSNLTVTAAGKTSCLPGANYSLWNQGVWPYITGAGELIAGGVPQAANLSLHLDTIRATLQYLVPAFKFPTY